jgi:hypothetical protein
MLANGLALILISKLNGVIWIFSWWMRTPLKGVFFPFCIFWKFWCGFTHLPHWGFYLCLAMETTLKWLKKKS